MNYLAGILVALFAHAALATPVIDANVQTAGGRVPLKLELVTEPATRERGLMERQTLAPNDGMLFIFPETIRRSFWMKNTPLPLDLLFLDAEGKVVHIGRGTPYSLDMIDSRYPARAVIEVEAGQAAQRGITPGDRVSYQLPEGTHVH